MKMKPVILTTATIRSFLLETKINEDVLDFFIEVVSDTNAHFITHCFTNHCVFNIFLISHNIRSTDDVGSTYAFDTSVLRRPLATSTP